MKLKSIREIEPVASRCIEVEGDRKLFAVGPPGEQILSHNSVCQRNIIHSCIMRPEHWRFLGIDLKRVELSSYRAYSNVVLGVATILEHAIEVLRFAQQTMMTRYTDLEQLGYNDFLKLPEAGPALLVMVDEATELLSVSGVKALTASTPVKYYDGSFGRIGDVKLGDILEDSEGNAAPVIDKYAPEKEKCYRLAITSDKTGITEEVVSGYQHYWIFYNESPTGEISESDLTVTEDIVEFVNTQKKLPADEQTKVKFFRSGKDGNAGIEGNEWFTLDEVELIEADEDIYCISVDSPTKEFLVTHSCIPTHNTDEGKEQDELKGEAAMIIGSIARLGRAAGVHLVIATQRPDATVIAGETKQNLAVRIQCGRAKNSTASNMILESSEGLNVATNPPGRMYVDLNGTGQHGQGFFATSDWINEWLDSKGLNQDGSPKSGKTSRLAHLADLEKLGSSDLDEMEGHDNSAVIEQIRREETGVADEEDDESVVDTASESSETVGDDLGEDFGDFNSLIGDDEPSEETPSAPAEKPLAGDLTRPDLSSTEKTEYGRPEDDWDDDLESLIEENNNG